jgi:hypothetical protein
MNNRNKFIPILLAVTVPFLLACMYLTRMIQVPEPKMEKNADTVIKVLNGQNWVPLQALASETYTAAQYAKPGTLTFTVSKLTNEKPAYFSYGWCAKDQATLAQNLQHIKVQIYFNDGKLGTDVVHNVSFTQSDGQVCSDYGILTSDWPAGTYHLKAVATFDQKINDGMADYDPGDYILDYKVTVDASNTPATTP